MYLPWGAAGGYADFEKQLNQLTEVFNQIEGGENITGPIIGATPDALLAILNPNALNARERVEEVIQRNLREILGAQFTQREGEMLIARAFNPRLPDEVNAARLSALIQQMDAAARAKDEAAAYFNEHGTLWRWQGTLPTINDFDAAIDAVGGDAPAETTAPGAPQPQVGDIVQHPNDPSRALQLQLNADGVLEWVEILRQGPAQR